MKTNMGKIDRGIRVTLGISAVAAFAVGAVDGTLGYVAIGLGALLLGTSAMGFCPPYALFGINTCGKKASS